MLLKHAPFRHKSACLCYSSLKLIGVVSWASPSCAQCDNNYYMHTYICTCTCMYMYTCIICSCLHFKFVQYYGMKYVHVHVYRGCIKTNGDKTWMQSTQCNTQSLMGTWQVWLCNTSPTLLSMQPPRKNLLRYKDVKICRYTPCMYSHACIQRFDHYTMTQAHSTLEAP